jgi:hypothetical protein
MHCHSISATLTTANVQCLKTAFCAAMCVASKLHTAYARFNRSVMSPWTRTERTQSACTDSTCNHTRLRCRRCRRRRFCCCCCHRAAARHALRARHVRRCAHGVVTRHFQQMQTNMLLLLLLLPQGCRQGCALCPACQMLCA